VETILFPEILMLIMSGLGTVIVTLLGIISYFYITGKRHENEVVTALREALIELKTSMIAAATEIKTWMCKTDSRLDILETEHRIMHRKIDD
jgi:hypothetical protein